MSQRKRSGSPELSIRRSESSGAGQIATTELSEGSAAAAWIAWNPPMLDPRSATLSTCDRSSATISSTSSIAPGPNAPGDCP